MSNKKYLKPTYKHTGKMYGIVSLSTAPTKNKACLKRSKDNKSICYNCYSFKMMKQYNALNETLKTNYDILTESIITDEQIKNLYFINYRFIRLEAFGDLANITQAINYINIVNYYKDTNFAIWTKNPLIMAAALKQLGYTSKTGKPKNLQIILSSPLLNIRIDSPFWFVDKIFTVYDKETAKHININCGKKRCIDCLNCYKKGGKKYINEIKK